MAVQTRQSSRVVVFSTPTCSWCRKLKTYLKQNQVRFKDVDVSRDANAARDIARRTGQMGVPVTLINNHPIVGFDKAQIDRMLGLRG